MAATNDEVFTGVIHSLARTTAAAVANGYSGVAYATIEVQYVISTRIRPWFKTEYLQLSNFTVLEYTIKALEAEVAAFAPITKHYTCPDECASCLATAQTVSDKTFCLMRYAACIGDTFTVFAERTADG